MADPVWPTEPWYLANNFKLDLGYLVEHIHRIAGWVTGLAATVFTLGAWLCEPNPRLRIIGILSLVGLLGAYGEFHRSMGKIWNEVRDKAAQVGVVDLKQSDAETRLTQLNIAQYVDKWPVPQGIGTAAFAVGLVMFGVSAAASGKPGGTVRLMASVALICVMAQGLLGGFRVFLNAIAGTNLAAIHGVFGQLTFAVLVAAMVLCAPRFSHDSLDEPERSSLAKLALTTLVILVVQLIWAVWVRHIGSAVAQRLHLLTAFIATGYLVWLAATILFSETAKRLYRGTAIHLMFILGCQLTLGVEAYLGKFVATGPQAQLLPSERTVTKASATVRTGHQLIGAALLASVTAAYVRFLRRPVTITATLPPAKSEAVRSTELVAAH